MAAKKKKSKRGIAKRSAAGKTAGRQRTTARARPAKRAAGGKKMRGGRTAGRPVAKKRAVRVSAVRKRTGRGRAVRKVRKKQVRRAPARTHVRIENIIPLERLQGIQDSFAAAFDVALLFSDETGRPLTRSVHLPQFCVAFAAQPAGGDTPGAGEAAAVEDAGRTGDRAAKGKETGRGTAGRPVCPKCGHEVSPGRIAGGLARRARSGKPFLKQCPGAHADYYVPLLYRRRPVGFCIIAQSAQIVDPARYGALAEQLGVDPRKAMAAIRSVRILPGPKLKQLGVLMLQLMDLVMSPPGARRRGGRKKS